MPNIIHRDQGREALRPVEIPETKPASQDKSAVVESTESEQFKFPTFQEITDWMVTPGDFVSTYDNPYYAMLMEENEKGPEADSTKLANLEEQAMIYGEEAEKNFKENLKYYNENEQPAALHWLGENLDAFDLATAPISTGLAPAKVLAKAGPLARVGAEAVLQSGLEGIHSGVEGESIAGGALTGGASGMLGGVALAPSLYPTVKRGVKGGLGGILGLRPTEKTEQAVRKGILEEAIPLMEKDKRVKNIVGKRLNRIKDGPLMTKKEFMDIAMPNKGGYFTGDIRNPDGRITQFGFETDLIQRIQSHGSELEGVVPKGELKNFLPTKETGEPPILNTILDMLPTRVDEWGHTVYRYEDVMNALQKWSPKTNAEKNLKDMLIQDYMWSFPISDIDRGTVNRSLLLQPHEKLHENYPGLGLAGLQGLYHAPSDLVREGPMEDLYEGAQESWDNIKNSYKNKASEYLRNNLLRKNTRNR